MMFYWIFYLPFVAFLQNASGVPQGRIIGGGPAHLGQFPYAAAITVSVSGGKHFCVGALFHEQWIITSGFCVFDAVHFDILLGITNLRYHEASVLQISASESIVHPLFDHMSIQNNIGLIKFNQPIMLSEYIQPIDLLATDLPDSTLVQTVGWGQIDNYQPAPVDELRFVNVVTLSNAQCRKVYGSQITEEMVCVAGNYNEGTCNGDMGAPLILHSNNQHIHVGIASFLSGNGCENTDPSGFTRTLHYTEWIRNVTRN